MTEAEFINENKHKPITTLALLLSKKPELDSTYILAQINGLQKAKTKLPDFYNNPNIIYPSKLSIEQCSSEKTGLYKSTLLRHSGLDPESSIIDLTGGFGIDSYYFSKKTKQVTYVEPNKELFETVNQNFKTLVTENILTVNATCEEFLKSNTQKFDLAYIDPSRRNENQKVFMLADCTPNIVELQKEVFKIAPKILVKTSPILDIKQSIKELKTVAEVWVVSVNNECKEVLYLLQKQPTKHPKIHTINLGKDEQTYSFDFNTEENATNAYSEPLNYLYEPNASILKAGAFKTIAQTYGLKKIAPNTHLYTSFGLADDFPGRTFVIKHVLPYQPKALKKLGITQANVSCRNFPDAVHQVKNKLNLKDGGEHYLFAFSDNENKALITISKKY